MSQEKFNNFLKRLYDNLYKHGIIKKKASTSKEKINIINNYFKRLEKRIIKIQNNSRLKKIIRKLYYKRYLIKEENIPHKYWLKIAKTYLNDGYGHFNLVNPRSLNELTNRNEHFHDIKNAWISTLDDWLDYFESKESENIPMWAKVWAFLGLFNIGTPKRNKKGFYKRKKETIYPLVPFNKEIFKTCVKYLEAHFNLTSDDIPKDLEELIYSESFFKIYGTLLSNHNEIKTNGNEGIWIKYDHNDHNASKVLFDSLQGYNTGWCTASSIENCHNQLHGNHEYLGGDFYVYYTKDYNNNFKIPRLAILFERHYIREARGIEVGEKVEAELQNILDTKLKEFPTYQKYKKTIHDTNLLTNIYQKYKTQELSQEELRFIYELDSIITTFGFDTDPRIKEILANRNPKVDLARACNCSINDIGIYPESFIGKKCYIGDIRIDNLEACDLKFPEIIIGSLILPNLKTLTDVTFPQVLLGNLYLPKVCYAKSITLPKIVKGAIHLESLTTFDSLIFPQNTICNYLYLGIKNSPSFEFPEIIDGNLMLPYLEDATNITLPKIINRSAFFHNLRNAQNTIFPTYIKEALFLQKLDVDDLLFATLPEQVELIYLKNNQSYTLPELKRLIEIQKKKLDLKIEFKNISEISNNPNTNLTEGTKLP